MSIEIRGGSERRAHERLVGRYMQEVRDIGEARFSRQELLKMGLVLGSGGLLALRGLRVFRPYWAHAADLQLTSPHNTPFQDPLPILPVVQPTSLNPGPTKARNTQPSALNGFPEAPRPDHQRWEEFLPQKQYEVIQKEVLHSFYSSVDGIEPYPLWTYVDAATNNVGPLRFKATYGEPIAVRVHNALPSTNHGFGINETSTHLHNAHTASESDGGPTHFYSSGQFKDYHYPNVRAGFASTHPTSTFNGRTVRGDALETLSTLWFHDHRFDFTSQNTYKGLTGFYTLFSPDIDLDTDDETSGLRLPSGEFDVPMIIHDKVFDPNTGEMFFDTFNLDGILGDKYIVNGKIQPYFEVQRRKYRFRLLDGGPSRVYEFFLSNGDDFVQISNDGNLLPRPIRRKSIRLGVAERVDVIVDFSRAPLNSKIYLENRLEQVNGRGPTGKIIAPTQLVEFRVVGPPPQDPSRIPTTLLPLPARRAITQQRSWEFGRSNGVWTINGNTFHFNIDEGLDSGISTIIPRNSSELWTLKSGGGWMHPIHVHLEEFRLMSRNGKSVPADEVARKDVVRIGSNAVGTQSTGEAKFYMQFRDWTGDYPLHCHNTVHEDHAMMVRWKIE